MLIYKITNKVNGKVYIGQTTKTLKERFKAHLDSSRCTSEADHIHLYQAMNKYGVENFYIEKICDADTKEQLNKLEIFYIKKYDSIKNGYNMVAGGQVNVMDFPEVKELHDNIMKSDLVREKISKSMKQYRKEHPFSDLHRQRLSQAMMGNHNFGRSDTRSIPCYCVVDGKEYHFNSYLEAGKWWYENYKPFPYSSCAYQHKIKQNIQLGYCTYGKEPNKLVINNIKWYIEGGDKNEKVADKG